MEFPQVPMGFRFRPTHEECIHYLTRKVTSKPLPCDGLILDLDPYDVKQLPDIFSSAQKNDALYLFTKLHKKGRIGNINANRKVGKGTWHGNRTYPVSDSQGRRIGMYRKFNYREKGSSYNCNFLMTEYTLLEGTPLQYNSLTDCVLCHITKSDRSSSRNTNSCIDQVALLEQLPDSIVTVSAADSVPSISSDVTHEDILPLPTTTESQPVYSPDWFLQDSESFDLSPDEMVEVLMSLDNEIPTLDVSWENISASSSSYSSQLETPTFGTPLPAPQDDFQEILMMLDYDADIPSFERSWMKVSNRYTS